MISSLCALCIFFTSSTVKSPDKIIFLSCPRPKFFFTAKNPKEAQSLRPDGLSPSELLAPMQHTKAYKKRSEIFLEGVRRIEQEGHFPSSLHKNGG